MSILSPVYASIEEEFSIKRQSYKSKVLCTIVQAINPMQITSNHDFCRVHFTTNLEFCTTSMHFPSNHAFCTYISHLIMNSVQFPSNLNNLLSDSLRMG